MGILSVKQAVSKTMAGRPPLSSVALKYHGRMLDDDETIDAIVEEIEEDEDDVERTDDIGDEETVRVSLTADMVPPVDGKFGIDLRDKIGKLSTQEILQTYCLNTAAMIYTQEMQSKESERYEQFMCGSTDGTDEGEEEVGPTAVHHSLLIRKKAALLQRQLESSLTSETKQLLS